MEHFCKTPSAHLHSHSLAGGDIHGLPRVLLQILQRLGFLLLRQRRVGNDLDRGVEMVSMSTKGDDTASLLPYQIIYLECSRAVALCLCPCSLCS